jgi:hypothetical protein
MIQLRLLPAVFNDVAAAARWYDEEGYQGLGDRFINIFYSYLFFIQGHGEAYAKVFNDFRRVLLKPFPYALYYTYHAEWLVVSLVIHTARSPGLQKKLLKERRS